MTEKGREGERESNKRDGGKKRKKGIERGMKRKEEEGRVTAAVHILYTILTHLLAVQQPDLRL